jgi:hypothetical protein
LALESSGSQRLFIVRKLSLGKIGSAVAPTSLSSLIEDDVRRMRSSAIPGTHSDARNSGVVFFEDPISACVALALRLSSGASTDAWYWPLAVTHYHPRMTRDAALRAVLFNVLDNEPPALAVAAFIAALCEHRRVMPLLAALRPEDMVQVQARCGWHALMQARAPSTPSADVVAAGAVSADRLPYARALRAALQAWDAATDLKPWLAALLLIAGSRQRAADADLSARAHEWLTAIESSGDEVAGADRLTDTETRLRSTLAREPILPIPIPEANADDATGEIRIHTRHVPQVASISNQNKQNGARDVPRTVAQLHDDQSASTNAGLLFLINAAARLGLQQWLATNRDWASWGLVPRLFESLGARLGISDADPIRAPVPSIESERPAPARFVLPVAWRVLVGGSRIEQRVTTPGTAQVITALSGRLPLAGWRDDAAAIPVGAYEVAAAPSGSKSYRGSLESAVIEAWITAMRLWCRRYCGSGLVSVVRRTGYIVHSATHVNVNFDLKAADIRLRRAGLDIDPGWVAWFGRIVTFHYGAEHR